MRLREAFGIFPSGVVAVAAGSTAPVGPRRELVHLGLPGPAAGLVLDREQVPDLAHAAARRPPRRHDPGRPPRRRRRQLAGQVAHRFDGVVVTLTDEGAVTLDDGLAQFDCTIHNEVEAGDHTIVILRCTPSSTPTPLSRWSSTGAGSVDQQRGRIVPCKRPVWADQGSECWGLSVNTSGQEVEERGEGAVGVLLGGEVSAVELRGRARRRRTHATPPARRTPGRRSPRRPTARARGTRTRRPAAASTSSCSRSIEAPAR